MLSSDKLNELYETKLMSFDETEKSIQDVTSSKALLINFIVGSWCPMCIQHFKRIAQSMGDKIENETLELVLVSTESQKKSLQLIQKLHRSEKEKSLSKLFKKTYVISDSSRKLVNILDIRIPVFGFAKPATFLLQTNGRLFCLSKGVPNLEQAICDLRHYFP